MRGLAACLYAIAAASMLLAGGGLVVAPHRVPAGTPLVHEHPVTALRFPLLLVAGAPGIPDGAALREEGSRHAEHLAATRNVATSFTTSHELALLAAVVVLALLGAVVPRLPRPSRRVIAALPAPRLAGAQWRAPSIIPPPRYPIFSS